jgi:hypothetical protein
LTRIGLMKVIQTVPASNKIFQKCLLASCKLQGTLNNVFFLPANCSTLSTIVFSFLQIAALSQQSFFPSCKLQHALNNRFFLPANCSALSLNNRFFLPANCSTLNTKIIIRSDYHNALTVAITFFINSFSKFTSNE